MKKIKKLIKNIKFITKKPIATLTLIVATIFAIILILIIVFCGKDNNAIDLKKEAYGKISINGQEILLKKDTAQEEIDLYTLNNKYDTKVKVELKDASIKINGKKIKNNSEISLGKIDIKKENKIKVEFKIFGDSEYKEYLINTIPSTFPEYNVESKEDQSQDYEYYITTYGESSKTRSYIYNINQKGELTFYKQTIRHTI